MKFFLDANIPHSALSAFKDLNLEAFHARDAGLARATDKEIIEHAARNNSILVTKDLEFANPRLFSRKSHSGVVVLRLPVHFKAAQFVQALKDFLTSIKAKELEKATAIVKLGSYRIRKSE